MSFFGFFRRKKSQTAVVTNSTNVTVNQIENYTEKNEAALEWAGLSVFADDGNEANYSVDESGSAVLVKPLFTLQAKSDWPGRYKLEFPLTLDLTFNNSGDKPAVLNSIEMEVLDARIDNQAAFEASPEVDEEGNLRLQLRNYGWGGNEIKSIELLSDGAGKYWAIETEATACIEQLEGHLTFLLKPALAGKLEVITESETEQLKAWREQLGFWTPNPLFGKNFDETDELNQFLTFRKQLIAEHKILSSETFYGRISYLENGIAKEYKLNWGFVRHAATSYDLIKTASGFELVRYQHPLAYLPPSTEYQARISVNDKGKTITVKTSQSIEGGKSDRFLIKIHPVECLFADITIKANFNNNKQSIYPKPIKLGLLEYKDNGDFRKEQQPINTIEYKLISGEKLVLRNE
ncbi:MAG: hypothetical protein AB9834_06365 [Lentimicrobium sp.]